MSTLKVTEIQSNSTAFNTPVRFETSGGTENGQLAKAWVNFNGDGTVAIRADFNVNTISDGGTGLYTVNFSTALTDINFGFNITSGFSAANPGTSFATGAPANSSSLEVRTGDTGTARDRAFIGVSAFR